MRRPPNRVIVVKPPNSPDPHLEVGLTIIDRRIVWESGDVELLVAGDCLAPVLEGCEAPRRTVDEVNAFAREWAKAHA